VKYYCEVKNIFISFSNINSNKNKNLKKSQIRSMNGISLFSRVNVESVIRSGWEIVRIDHGFRNGFFAVCVLVNFVLKIIVNNNYAFRVLKLLIFNLFFWTVCSWFLLADTTLDKITLRYIILFNSFLNEAMRNRSEKQTLKL
jgi:hypothetical protein